MSDGRLPFDDAPEAPGVPAAAPLPDQAARDFAVDPGENVVLEASAGTGKTRVLVERYVNLLLAGVDPENILAITFTRKAAAEMRQRIIERLREASRLSQIDAGRWRDLRDRLGEIAISTIDAFCLALLREFPLEADVDPGFDLADETEVPRLAAEALDSALRICRAVAADDDDVALVFAQLGERRLRAGLAALLDRRLVAPQALRRYLASGPRDLTAQVACERAAERLRAAIAGVAGGVDAFLADGPNAEPSFAMLAADVRALAAALPPLATRAEQALFRGVIDRLRAYFLKQDGEPRGDRFLGTPYSADGCTSAAAWKRHRAAAAGIAPAIAEAIRGFRRDLNVVLSRGVWRIFAVALKQFQDTLEAHALLDFSGVLERTLELLQQMEEFARSRYRLESRYQHVLVDEFQDTSRAQWELVAQLVRSWGEGLGVGAGALAPSIFVVGDRKQSIYGFRDADVAVIEEAAAFIQQLRGGQSPRRAISMSFRSAPALLAFVNDLFDAIDQQPGRRDAFRYRDDDRFPLAAAPEHEPEPRVGMLAGGTVGDGAERVGDEIVRLLSGTTVRDRATGIAREAVASDIAILFRSRESHREFESALERRGVASYVYKGLGFFDADEIQDVVAVLRFLADPASDLRAAALLRSRIVRLSDPAIAALAPSFAAALTGTPAAGVLERLGDEDRRVLAHAAVSIDRWLALVDRVPPAELVDTLLAETAYAFELRGPRRLQARENVKKLRAMIRRVQNRGYATLGRIADHLERLAVGDESNASIDAVGAVSLMTVHAAKGLEFPIVFVVNVGRGTGNSRAPIRVSVNGGGEPSVAVADYQSEADEDARAREREETKRLLYVALTRARDRLYLATTLRDGVAKMNTGSLGEVLPRPIADLFAQAPAGGDLTWTGPSGSTHRIAARSPCELALSLPAKAGSVVSSDDFAGVKDSSPARSSVLAHVAPGAAAWTPAAGADSSDTVVGTLAHRLFPVAGDRERLRARATAWAADAGIELDEGTIARAIDAASALRGDDRVRETLASGRAYYETAFSFRTADRTILRGSIDCLVRGGGRTTVIELKTGAKRPEHEAQLAVYVDAACALFPGDDVDGLLVYAGDGGSKRTRPT